MNGNAITLCFAPDHLNDAANRRLPKVRQVHRNLCAAFDQKSKRFHISQSARRLTNGFRDFLGDVNFGCRQINIEGDQRTACADHGRTRSSKFRGAIIRFTIRIGFNLRFESLVLSSANIFEIGSFGTRRRRFIQIDRDVELATDALT